MGCENTNCCRFQSHYLVLARRPVGYGHFEASGFLEQTCIPDLTTSNLLSTVYTQQECVLFVWSTFKGQKRDKNVSCIGSWLVVPCLKCFTFPAVPTSTLRWPRSRIQHLRQHTSSSAVMHDSTRARPHLPRLGFHERSPRHHLRAWHVR